MSSSEPSLLKNRFPISGRFHSARGLFATLLLLALGTVPAARGQTFLFDFCGGNRMDEGEDEFNYWNNVTGGVADNSAGRLDDIPDTAAQPSPIDLVMIARFNGVNENGTQNGTEEIEGQVPAPFPVDATRDSWYGNTENFGAGTDFFPSFKLSELDPGTAYTLTFYASRMGVNDNRETQYTVTGATETTAFLDVANNIDQVATVTGMRPDAEGEITILIGPGPNNNNGNHFTYLGVLKLEAAAVVVPDITPPELLSTASAGPWRVSLTFSEPLNSTTAIETDRYTVNDGVVSLSAAEISPDGKTVHLFPVEAMTGDVSVKINGVTDRAGNPLAANTTGTATVPQPDGKSLLFDFGSNGTGTENVSVSDDPLNAWNNIRADFSRVDGNEQTDLVNTKGEILPGWSLVIVSRFNSDNTNGTTGSPLYPADATRDSLFGNTADFGGVSDITPIFKLTGLTPSVPVDFSFFASRMLDGGENRETVYTVTGANEKTSSLDPVNNLENTAEVTGILPTAEGEINISLTPGPNNTNANLFTYLGVMKVTPQAANPGGEVEILSPVLQNGKIIVNWTGTGALESSTTLTGQWTPVTPAPSAPYSEDIAPGQRKFFCVRK